MARPRLRLAAVASLVCAGLAAVALLAALNPAPTAPGPRAIPDVDAARDATADRRWLGRWDGLLEDAAGPRFARSQVRVARGDTLAGLLQTAGASAREAHLAVRALGDLYDPRQLQVGDRVTLVHLPRAGLAPRLHGFALAPSAEQRIEVRRDGSGFRADAVAVPLTREMVHRRGEIATSLYDAAVATGVPVGVLAELIHVFSFDVDFQREVRLADGFEILFEQFFFEDGRFARNGTVLFAALTLSGERRALYRFESAPDRVDYYDAAGKSARKALMRTPIDGARLSSRFGMRRHPLLGYSRMHRGIDFAAPPGTPVYAAGDGVVERAGKNGNYGRYVRIRHNGTYRTAYAHLKGIAKGVRRGRRVRQGQVIGYVGSSGLSTGPHLHYEILKSGKHINPMKLRLPSGRQLAGDALAAFGRERDRLDALVESRSGRTAVADSGDRDG